MPTNLYRVNQHCKFFPCHEGLEDCTFCFCPFYPCKDKEKGKYVKTKTGRVWDCSECNWIHKKELVDRISELIKNKIKVGN